MDEPFLLDLGVKVVSRINGFHGMIISRAEHLNGCNRYFVLPPVDKDGKMLEGYWFDEGELEVVEQSTVERRNNDRGGFPSKTR